MTKDELVEKIKKILALAESSNPNEAAVALQRAQKLMEKYKIEASDLDNDCSISEIKVEPVTGLKSRDCTSLLLGIICKNFGVEAFSFFNKSSLSYVIFVGPKEILASCEYVYVLLARYTLAAQKNYNTTVWGETLLEVEHQDFYTEQIKRINPKFYKDFLGEIIETVSKAKDLDLPSFHLEYLGKQFQAYLDVYKDYDYESTKKFFQKMVSDKRKAFLNGFLLEVAKKVQELALTDEETDNINAYLKKNYPQLRTYHKRNKAMSDQEVSAFSAGQNEGQKAQINTAINNHAPERKRLK